MHTSTKKWLFIKISSLILIPISIFFIIEGSVFFSFFLSILFLATSYEWFKMCKKNDILKLLGIAFLLFSFYAAYEFRESENYKDFLFPFLKKDYVYF